MERGAEIGGKRRTVSTEKEEVCGCFRGMLGKELDGDTASGRAVDRNFEVDLRVRHLGDVVEDVEDRME